MQRLSGEPELAPQAKADLREFVSMFDGEWAGPQLPSLAATHASSSQTAAHFKPRLGQQSSHLLAQPAAPPCPPPHPPCALAPQTRAWRPRAGWMARATCRRARTSCSARQGRGTWWRKVRRAGGARAASSRGMPLALVMPRVARWVHEHLMPPAAWAQPVPASPPNTLNAACPPPASPYCPCSHHAGAAQGPQDQPHLCQLQPAGHRWDGGAPCLACG